MRSIITSVFLCGFLSACAQPNGASDQDVTFTKESGKNLDLFMKYINLKSKFTHRTSDYYIMNKIKQLYKDFQQEDPEFKNSLNDSDEEETINNHLRQ